MTDKSPTIPAILLPDATLGVMGGGQLGRMFLQAAQSLGYTTAVLDPDPLSPAGAIAHHHIQTDYADPAGLTEMAQRCAAITTEFENVPATALEALAKTRPVHPPAQAVFIAQERRLEKQLFIESGIGCADHAFISNLDEQQKAQAQADLFPALLKTNRLGYDGKGQVRVDTPSQLISAWESLGKTPCLLEKMMPLAAEISVLVARNQQGQVIHFPVQHNLHRNGILAVTEVPRADECTNSPWHAFVAPAIQAAQKLITHLNYVGVLCVEFFITQEGRLIANEIAPRPHNSAHWSMNGSNYSQFEAQVRSLAGLPQPPPVQHSSTIMLNLLGDLWFASSEQPISPPWDKVLALTGTHLHLYGKKEAKKGRKMGHLNITANTIEQARSIAYQAAQILQIDLWDDLLSASPNSTKS